MMSLLAVSIPVVIVAIIGLYLYLKYSIKKELESESTNEAVRETLDVKKESEIRRNDNMADVDKRMREFTRKE
jgi:hypothetical protein